MPQSAIDKFEREASFRHAMATAINSHSRENGSNTPDFILGDMLSKMLEVFDEATRRRDQWHKANRAITDGYESQGCDMPPPSP